MNMRAFPEAKELERGLIGALTLDPDLLSSVATILEPEHFYNPVLGELYSALLALQAHGGDYDPRLLIEALPGAGFDLAGVGGVAAFLELGDGAPVPVLVPRYAEQIRDKAMRRAALGRLHSLTEAMHEPHADPQQEIDEALSALVELRGSNMRRTSTTLHDAVVDLAVEYDEATETGAGRGLPTGYYGIDRHDNCGFAGFWPGELVIICGHTSHGKTTFALNVVRNLLRRSQPGSHKKAITAAYFSAEMSAPALARRLVSIEAGIDASLQRIGGLCPEALDTWNAAADRLAHRPLRILDGGVTIEEVAAHSRIIDQQYRAEGYDGLGLVVIDYLQRLRPSDARLSREEQVAHMSWSAKQLALDLNIPVLCLAQPNREAFRGNNKRPRLHHLRDSGRIEQDADTVMSVYWGWKERDTQADDGVEDVHAYEVEVLKCRNGRLGQAMLYFDPQYTRLRDYPRIGG